MSQETAEIRQALSTLRGKPGWGLVRTYGSMFFLEVGKPLSRASEKKIHGEWHFLVEMSPWRVDTPTAILVGSDDEPGLIDSTFAHLDLGTIEAADASPPAHDLRIVFSSGIRLTTFSTAARGQAQETRWQLFSPDDYVWIVEAGGSVVHKSAYV